MGKRLAEDFILMSHLADKCGLQEETSRSFASSSVTRSHVTQELGLSANRDRADLPLALVALISQSLPWTVKLISGGEPHSMHHALFVYCRSRSVLHVHTSATIQQKLNACHENTSEKPGSNPTDVAKTRADAGQPSRIDEKAVDPEDRSDRAGAASPDPEPHPSRTMTVRRILGMYDGLLTRPRDAGGRRGRFRRVVVESTRAVVRCVTSSSGNARPSRRDGSTPPAPARTFVFSRSEEWVREAPVLAWRSSN
ncbi:hypothetical protein HO133_009161 [Letharia lupina]|uniref:Uncharacterized protein n=1 Tax=Letharia lupina TaxID=560253 RepID=A0A8H6FFD4_9LECA|nr:uncharacterized protein HO133_009161 [Letharia lupina]KAF6226295.1 hypothetical protein HO133_009161 [Letharia lupina]